MENIHFILLFAFVTLIVVVIFILMSPPYMPYPVIPYPIKPHPVMPQFGPYWTHGGQANSGLLY